MSNLFDTDPSCNCLAEGKARRDSVLSLLEATRANLICDLQIAALRIGFGQLTFTADDVRAVVPIPHGIDPKVVGAAFSGLATAKLIRKVDYRKSARPEAHARPLTVWQLVNHHEAMTRLIALNSMIS